MSGSLALLLFTRMIHGAAVRLYLVQGEPRGLELFIRIEPRLIEVIGRSRIGVLAEDQDRSSLQLRSEFDHAHKRVACYAVAPLLALLRTRIKVVDDADPSGRSGDRQALLRVAERLFASALRALKPVDITPRNLPRTEAALKLLHHLFKRSYAHPFIAVLAGHQAIRPFDPKRKERHRF